jgi:DNA-binding FadR family transcriptional regulator
MLEGVMERRKLNTSDIVYRTIEEKILKQEWTQGMKIASENQLAQDLGVSRISVREAIEKMVALNVLSKRQGEGTFVNELSPSIYLNNLIPMILLEKDNLIDILEFRRLMEVDSARLCAEKCDDETIEFLEECYEEMCNSKDEPLNFTYADYNFHMGIARGTGNSLIIKVNSILMDLWKFHQQEINRYLGPYGGLHEHKKILDAIKDRDPDLAALFMRRHIERTLTEIRRIKAAETDSSAVTGL